MHWRALRERNNIIRPRCIALVPFLSSPHLLGRYGENTLCDPGIISPFLPAHMPSEPSTLFLLGGGDFCSFSAFRQAFLEERSLSECTQVGFLSFGRPTSLWYLGS